MREAFFDSLYEIACQDRRVILLTSDTGALVLDKFRKDLPYQCINVGIAEQNMIGVAAGLAMSGKIVYTYAIVPFVTMRCFEQIRVDLCCQNLSVKLIGVGAGLDYSTLGPTHHGLEDIALMRSLPGMTIFSPSDDTLAAASARMAYRLSTPAYIRLDRTGKPLIYAVRSEISNGVYTNSEESFSDGMSILSTAKDLCLIATGRMVWAAQKAAEKLSKRSIGTGVVDLYRIKPLNTELLLEAIGKVKYIATLEEHSTIGGIGSAISEVLAERKENHRLRRLGLLDKFCRQYGSRDYLQTLNNLDVKGVVDTLFQWMST